MKRDEHKDRRDNPRRPTATEVLFKPCDKRATDERGSANDKRCPKRDGNSRPQCETSEARTHKPRTEIDGKARSRNDAREKNCFPTAAIEPTFELCEPRFGKALSNPTCAFRAARRCSAHHVEREIADVNADTGAEDGDGHRNRAVVREESRGNRGRIFEDERAEHQRKRLQPRIRNRGEIESAREHR